MGVGIHFLQSAWEVMVGDLERERFQWENKYNSAVTAEQYTVAGYYQSKLEVADPWIDRIKATIVISTWDTWDAAYDWSVEIGAQPNIYAARNSLKNLLETEFGGNKSKAKEGEVKYAYYKKQLAKSGTTEPTPTGAD